MSDWRPVPGYPGYSATSDGDLRGPSGKVLSPTRDRGHLYVLTRGGPPGQPRKLYIRRAVLLAFDGPALGREARNRNGDPTDNRLSNLCWGQRTGRNGRDPVGATVTALAADEIDEIRGRYPDETLRALAAEFGVSPADVRRAATERAHV